jgi:hypothetical protein
MTAATHHKSVSPPFAVKDSVQDGILEFSDTSRGRFAALEQFNLENQKSPSGPSQRTVKRLFAVSGNRCAFPNCRTGIVNQETILGEICHIKSARPNGPRYDALQSADERHGYDNLILLCANHHTVIDDDEEAYTVERLAKMKREHEASAPPLSDDDANAGAALIVSVAQMGGITAQTVNAHTIHVHPPATAIDSAAMTAAQASRALAALGIFAPELARILAQQIHIFDRAIVNFICASAGNPPPTDHWTTFRPWKPNLYPGTAEFRELANEDAALLVEFYDSLNEIDDLVRGWRESETVWDVNVWNYLMQKVHHSVSAGVLAAERFCPSRQFNVTMPAAGTLVERATISTASMRSALAAHIDRFNNRATAKPSPIVGAHVRRR